MKKIFENFTTIDYSSSDRYNSQDYLPENNYPYSKIIVQFEKDFELEDIEEPYEDIADHVVCYDTDYDRNQYIYYTISEDAINDVTKFFKNYICDIYQLIFNEVEEEVNKRLAEVLKEFQSDIFNKLKEKENEKNS